MTQLMLKTVLNDAGDLERFHRTDARRPAGAEGSPDQEAARVADRLVDKVYPPLPFRSTKR
jgi:hypothetical protein